jgi:uncharacterized protein
LVHSFEVAGRFFALDGDSGAVHMLDKMGFDCVRAAEELGFCEGLAAMKEKYGGEAEALFAELSALKDEGLLFLNDEALHAQPQEEAPSVVKALCLHVAHDCNLRCRYCFAGTGAFHGERLLMPLEVGKKALDLLVARSGGRRALEVDFFGGEPMMNFGVVKELVAYGRELEGKHGKRIRFTLTTNAYELSDDDIAFLNKEMANLVLSLDGRQAVHDALRPTKEGGSSYAQSLENAKKVAKSRNQQGYYVRGTFTRNNLDFAKDVLALSDAGFEQISVEPVVLRPDSPYSLKEEHLPAILNEYDRLLEQYLKRRREGKWFSFFHFVVDLEGGPCLKKRLTGCGAGSEYLAVTPDGEIYPCHQFVGREGFLLGNVFDGKLNDEMRASFANNHVLSKEKCAGCWARLYCSGGCAANAQAFSGSIARPYDMECEMEKKRLECAVAAYCAENVREEEASD